MKELLTTRQVARAIGVSQASLKRWCDKGLLPSVRTVGGHRRLPLAGVIEFLRRGGHDLVRPEVLGLPATTGRGHHSLERAAERARAALEAGDEEQIRGVLFDLYLAGHPVTEICDQVLKPAFRTIGDDWQHGSIEVYQERLACEICRRALYEIGAGLRPPAPEGPHAIGGTLCGDPYTLPTAMVELALREAGWHAQSLGVGHPAATLCAAIAERRPLLFWLSVSHVEEPDRAVADCTAIYRCAGDHGAAFVVGGRALTDDLRQRIPYTAYGDTLTHLSAFARTIHTAKPPGGE